MNIYFFNQFRGDVPYARAVDHHYSGICFRAFSMQETKVESLVKLLNGLNDNTKIELLIVCLETKALPGHSELLRFTQKFLGKISVYVSQEPYTGKYYSGLVGLLSSFIKTVSDSTSANQCILKNLKAFRSQHIQQFGAEEADIASSEMDQFIYQITEGYKIINSLIEDDSSNSNKVLVTTHMDEYLSQLINLSERLVANLDLTLTQLRACQVQFLKRQEQTVYN